MNSVLNIDCPLMYMFVTGAHRIGSCCIELDFAVMAEQTTPGQWIHLIGSKAFIVTHIQSFKLSGFDRLL